MINEIEAERLAERVRRLHEDKAPEIKEERYEVAGHRLHVVDQPITDPEFDEGTEHHEWAVWLNTEGEDYDGLCIGVGETRHEAVTQAVAALEAVVAQLQQPEPEVKQ